MKNIFRKTILAIFLISICLIKPAAQIAFKADWQGDSIIRVDKKISFKVEIKNNKRHKVTLREPALGKQVHCFIREDSDSVWSGITVETLSDVADYLMLGPKLSNEAYFSIYPSIQMLPKKKYYLKIIYYPIETWNYRYDPNRSVKYPRSLYKEDNLVFFTDTLSQKSLEEWLWIDEHKLRKVYYNNRSLNVDKDDFEQVKKFLELYPNSIFINTVKEMYIEFVAYLAPINSISIDVIDNAIAYYYDIKRSGNFEKIYEGHLGVLLERKGKVKN